MDSIFHAHTKFLTNTTTNNNPTIRPSSPDDVTTPPPSYSDAISTDPDSDSDDELGLESDTAEDDHIDHLSHSGDSSGNSNGDNNRRRQGFHHNRNSRRRSRERNERSTRAANMPSHTLNIDASTTIHGSQNTIAAPPIDGPRLTAIILGLLQGQGQGGQGLAQGQPAPAGAQAARQQPQAGMLPARRPHERRIVLRMDCSLNIVGDRNLVGAATGWGVPRVGGMAAAAPATVATNRATTATATAAAANVNVNGNGRAAVPAPGAVMGQKVEGTKRKAETEPDGAPEAKKVDVEARAGANVEA